MFVSIVAFLLREERWNLLGDFVAGPIPMRYLPDTRGPANAEWFYASQHLPSLIDESTRRSRVSLHADILNERHTKGGLGAVMPIDEFVAGDYFLFLRGEMMPSQRETWMIWRPWSALYLKSTPLFLRSAEYNPVAAEVMRLFGISDPDEFKKRFGERAHCLRELFRSALWFNPVEYDITKFGTR